MPPFLVPPSSGLQARGLASRAYVAPAVLRAFGVANFTAFLQGVMLPHDRGSKPGEPLLLGTGGGVSGAVDQPWRESQCELLVLRLEAAPYWPSQLAAAAPVNRAAA